MLRRGHITKVGFQLIIDLLPILHVFLPNLLTTSRATIEAIRSTCSVNARHLVRHVFHEKSNRDGGFISHFSFNCRYILTYLYIYRLTVVHIRI